MIRAYMVGARCGFTELGTLGITIVECGEVARAIENYVDHVLAMVGEDGVYTRGVEEEAMKIRGRK